MSLYGYKISGLARSEKYFEAERLLDKKLKNFEKDNAVFEEDGSIRQIYRRKNEDGSETEITLVKNITESAVIVFSDIPLKFLKYGGIILYVRDIAPTIIFAVLYYFLYKLALRYFMAYSLTALTLVALAAAAIFTVTDLLTYRLLDKNRSRLRIRFIQSGSIFTVIALLYYFTRLFAYWNLNHIWYSMLQTPLPSVLAALIICTMIGRASERRK